MTLTDSGASAAPAGPRPGVSIGEVAPGFEDVRSLFDEFLARDADYSAQVCVYLHGRPVVDLSGGPHLGHLAMTGVFSSTKGVAALTLARLVERGDLDLETPVAAYWPEFAAHGKSAVSVSQLLSHQAGLVGVPGMRIAERYDSREVAAALAAQRPFWRPGSAFGYHGTAIGPLMEELFRRIAGEELQEHYEREVRAPLGADMFVGLPDSEEARYAPVLPPMRDAGGVAGTGAGGPERGLADSLQAVAFFGGGPIDPSGAIEPNLRHLRAAGIASIGGVGNARGLARVYAAAVTGVEGVDGGRPFLSSDTVDAFSQEQSWGVDRVLGRQMCFATVFQKPYADAPWGSWRAIGHDGAAGSMGFADPEHGLAFGYVRRRMAVPGGLDALAVRLSGAVRAVVARG